MAGDAGLQESFRRAKREAKTQFADWLRSTTGQLVDIDTIFDCQIKRIHEYKRQLLNALRVIVVYNQIRQNPKLDVPPRTFFFAGKAAPAYHLAKTIIKFLTNLAGTIDGDSAVKGRLKVLFLPDYLEAHERLSRLYAQPNEWARKTILNIAGSGKFSSDRTIAEYSAGIWKTKPCPVSWNDDQ